MAISTLQIASLFYALITLYIFSLITYRRVVEKIIALDYFMWIFGLLSIAGFIQFLNPLIGDQVWILSIYKGEQNPLMYDIVRDLAILTMLVIYLFAEHSLRDQPSVYRVSIAVSSAFVYILVFLYYQNTGSLILMSQLFDFMQPTRLDEFAYDVILMQAVILIAYSFKKQYNIADVKQARNNLRLLWLAFSLFALLYTIEFAEHFFDIPDINFVYFTIPLFLGVGFVYLRNPRFVFYTPSDIHFIQVATSDGHLIFVSEFQKEGESIEYLIPVSLSSINSLFMEMIGRDTIDFQLNSINFDDGSIIFEREGDLYVILYVEQPTRILRRSIRYFIQEFNRVYGKEIQSFEGGIMYKGKLDAEPLIRKCIPIVQSKDFISRIDPKVPGGIV